MVSSLWFQVFLSLKLTSPMTWIMLFTEMASCSAYSHSAVQFGHPGYEIIKLLKSICYTKQIKLLGSFRKKQQSNLFSPMTSSEAAFWNRVLQSGSSNYFIANLWLSTHISSSSQLSAGQSAYTPPHSPSLNTQYVFLIFHWVCHSETRKVDYIRVPRKCEGTQWAVNLLTRIPKYMH